MPAPNDNNPQDPLEYLVHGTKSADKRNTVLENEHGASGWVNPVLINNFAAPPAPYTSVQYRWHFKSGSLEFRGYVDAYSAVTNTAAFVIIQAMRPAHNVSFLVDMETVNASTFSVARWFIDAATGEAILIWPAV